MKLKDVLKLKRVEKGFSQEKLATLLGYTSGQFISNWERGESFPPIDRLAKLSLLFGYEDETLLNLFLKESSAAVTKEYVKAIEFHKSFK
jgi:transcriptional regulator with XRE-family HTH domain